MESRYYDGIDRCESYEIHRPRGDTGRMEDGVRLAVGKRLLQAQAKKVDPTADAEGIIVDYSTSAVEHI